MIRLTLAQMRRGYGRLIAAGIAIALGTAFVAITLVAGAVIERTSVDALAAQYADADLIVSRDVGGGRDLSMTDVEAARSIPGVAAADAMSRLWASVGSGDKQFFLTVVSTHSDPRLEPQVVDSGSWPDAPGEIALPVDSARNLDVKVGDSVVVSRSVFEVTGDGVDARYTSRQVAETLRVTAIVSDPYGAFASVGGAVVVQPDDYALWQRQDVGQDGASFLSALEVVVAPGVPPAQVSAALAETLDISDNGFVIRTKAEEAAHQAASLTNSNDTFTLLVLGFAAIALLVAALVISNTFQVLVAQRTHTLALLRCVGASRRQLRTSVLFEALLLGGASSVLGLVLGLGIAQGGLSILREMDVQVPLPATIPVTAAVILVPLLAGMVVAVVAAFAPARAATRVAPLEAMRPSEAPAVRSRSSRVRAVVAAILVGGGLAFLAIGLLTRSERGTVAALGLGVLGGAASFVGLLVGAVFWMPPLVAGIGGLLGRTRPLVNLATANVSRNPRRTAATSSALLIGVTLVMLMSTGAATARTALSSSLDTKFSVDVALTPGGMSADGSTNGVSGTVLAAVRGVDGVAQAEPVRSMTVQFTFAGQDQYLNVFGVEPAAAASILRDPTKAGGLAPGTILVPRGLAGSIGLSEGTLVEVSAAPTTGDGSAVAPVRSLAVHLTSLQNDALLSMQDAQALAPGETSNAAWVRVANTEDAVDVVAGITTAASGDGIAITGGVVERASYDQVINTLLAVVIGLLAVSIVIALIGVANTLSLSVIERRRESATLRAIGLSRKRLRASMAIEGMLIAGVGGLVGCVLGVAYGWAGAQVLLGGMSDVTPVVPWGHLATVLIVSVLAGLLASIIPGRSAARTPPIAALAQA